MKDDGIVELRGALALRRAGPTLAALTGEIGK